MSRIYWTLVCGVCDEAWFCDGPEEFTRLTQEHRALHHDGDAA